MPMAELWFYVLLHTKQIISETFPKPISQLGAEKTKARFSRFLRHPAWKRTGPILVSALHKFVTYLLRHLPTRGSA